MAPNLTFSQPAQRVDVRAVQQNVLVSAGSQPDFTFNQPVQNIDVRAVQQNVVVTAGGQRGERGAPGGSIPAIAFSYGDAAAAIWTATDAGTLVLARVKITTAFNDPTALMSLGIPADHELVMPSDEMTPTAISEFETTPDIQMAAGDQVFIYPQPGVSTEGAGVIFLTFLPD